MTTAQKGELPPPSFCDMCASHNVQLTTNDRIYGRTYGTWPYIYHCQDCNAAVGCHPNTHVPLGRMADKETRQLRARAHEAFDPLWKSGLMTRSQAYSWLATELKLEHEAAHISWLTKEQLRFIVPKATEYFEERKHVADRRRTKRRDRSIKRDKRARSRIIARKNG